MGGIFGGGSHGPPPLTKDDVKAAVFSQLQKFEMIKYTELTFPSIQDGLLYPWMQTLGKTNEMRNETLSDSDFAYRLSGIEALLPTLSAELTNTIVTMDSGYL